MESEEEITDHFFLSGAQQKNATVTDMRMIHVAPGFCIFSLCINMENRNSRRTGASRTR